MEMTVGMRIKEYRMNLGMTQEELAEQLYVSKKTISAYESDKIDIKVSILQDIAKALNTTVGYLVEGRRQEFDLDVLQMATMLQEMPSEALRKAAMEQIKVLVGLGKFIK